jgi:UDP-glucose 4-epimerase
MISGRTILITGGAGFIGTQLALRLCANNRIVLFDNFSRNSYQFFDTNDLPNVVVVRGDVLDVAAIREAMAGVDDIVHAAAIAGIDAVIKEPVKTLEVNLVGTWNILRVASEYKLPGKVLVFSSSEVFGQMAFSVAEDYAHQPGSAGEARWIYGVSKLASEHLTQAYHGKHSLNTIIVRPFNVYGPGQTGEGALHAFIRRALRDEDIEIYGDGAQIRSWCYIDDFVDALMLCLDLPRAVGETFNIGNARAVTTIYGLAEQVIAVLNSSSRITFRPPLSADVQLRTPGVKKAEEMLGFRARVGLTEGIRRTADWIKQNDSR